MHDLSDLDLLVLADEDGTRPPLGPADVPVLAAQEIAQRGDLSSARRQLHAAALALGDVPTAELVWVQFGADGAPEWMQRLAARELDRRAGLRPPLADRPAPPARKSRHRAPSRP